MSIPDADEFADADDGDFEEPLPSLGTAHALYQFEGMLFMNDEVWNDKWNFSSAQSEGSIPMCEGEELVVVELDQGDGWTRVRRIDNNEEGFVPTSYIKCNLYNVCWL